MTSRATVAELLLLLPKPPVSRLPSRRDPAAEAVLQQMHKPQNKAAL